jgi:hypothetical protein
MIDWLDVIIFQSAILYKFPAFSRETNRKKKKRSNLWTPILGFEPKKAAPHQLKPITFINPTSSSFGHFPGKKQQTKT